MKRILSLILVITIIAGIPVASLAKTTFFQDPDAIQKAAESVLMLSCYDGNGNVISTGSGFLAFEDGIIVTNYHVVDGDVVSVLASTEDGLFFDISEVVCYDITADIAILHTDAKTRLDSLKIGNSDGIAKASRVIAIGSPLGLVNTVSEGLFNGFVDNNGSERILFTAAISHGSSGGALFNEDGEVIGITSASYIEGQNLNLAVPINTVAKLWEDYKSGTLKQPKMIDGQIQVSIDGAISPLPGSSSETVYEDIDAFFDTLGNLGSYQKAKNMIDDYFKNTSYYEEAMTKAKKTYYRKSLLLYKEATDWTRPYSTEQFGRLLDALYAFKEFGDYRDSRNYYILTNIYLGSIDYGFDTERSYNELCGILDFDNARQVMKEFYSSNPSYSRPAGQAPLLTSPLTSSEIQKIADELNTAISLDAACRILIQYRLSDEDFNSVCALVNWKFIQEDVISYNEWSALRNAARN